MSAARRTLNILRSSRKLIVLGLRWTTCQNILKDHFSKYGIVDNARVIFDLETGRSKGFGFIVMRDLQGAKKAMAAVPHVIEGKTVHTDHHLPRSALATANLKNVKASEQRMTRVTTDNSTDHNPYNENILDDFNDSDSSNSDSSESESSDSESDDDK